MSRFVLPLLALFIALPARAADNELTEQEKADGWILMFDGKTAKGWIAGKAPMPDKQVEDGTLNVKDQGAYVAHYEKPFKDFVFKCDFKLEKGVNSGLFFRIFKPGDGGIGRGWEIQVKDDAGKAPTRMDCGALYEYMAPTKQAAKPAGEWNSIEVSAIGPKVTVTLNGEKVLDADLDQWTEPGKNPDGSKNKFKWALKDQPREGHIGLSFHDKGKSAWYRNIKVKEVKQ
ncbi:MAG TPA: DUF1080 domain-containing protein [Tepidisphaeraceae bacterium]|nr:DUF1080 domain-containing protein [Tepidisphaeraceae bacterium]